MTALGKSITREKKSCTGTAPSLGLHKPLDGSYRRPRRLLHEKGEVQSLHTSCWLGYIPEANGPIHSTYVPSTRERLPVFVGQRTAREQTHFPAIFRSWSAGFLVP